ncbi:MAG: hypothetical protein NC483_03330 [Ruminococcus sp.]|nr:hypothetical protein [Ruminococcus sp.]
MNSEEMETKIKVYERENFRILKKIENKNRKQPISEDILYTSDFLFEEFVNSGDSGSLLLATNKTNSDDQYIIKHEYYDCACNEYMYSKVGNSMGIKIAPVKLFVVDDNEELFKSDFVCGIKYLSECEHINFDYVKKHQTYIKNLQDYFKMHCLESLFDESDGIEIVKYKDELYRLDTTAAFGLSIYYIYPLAYDYNKNGIDIQEFARKNLLKLATKKDSYRFNSWKHNLDLNIKKFGKDYLKYYKETFNLLKNVSEEDISRWTNILSWFYPNIIGEYYKLYFKNLKLDVDEFLKRIDNKELIAI